MDKQKNIVEMFNNIAPTYDLVNRVLSFGVDKSWRKEAVKNSLALLNKQKVKVLDVACGTGDMIEVWKNSASRHGIELEICGVDPSHGMLEVAKKRFPSVKFYEAYAIKMPILDNTIDAISISFGIRNVVDIQKGFDEFYRVLKKDGLAVILEFTKSKNSSVFRKAVDFYSNKILPTVGGILSKNKDAYTYLPNSIENFYTVEELCGLMEKSGFEIVKVKSFNFEQVSLVIAKK